MRGSEGLEQKRVRRATKDVDFAVVLPDWRAFAQLKGHLIRDHGFADEARQQHRLVFRAEGPGCGTPIDLVPSRRAPVGIWSITVISLKPSRSCRCAGPFRPERLRGLPLRVCRPAALPLRGSALGGGFTGGGQVELSGAHALDIYRATIFVVVQFLGSIGKGATTLLEQEALMARLGTSAT